MASFEKDIRPLFREEDVEAMLFLFDLTAYDEVKQKAQAIYEMVSSGEMPCDGAWPADRVKLFRQWMDEGYPR